MSARSQQNPWLHSIALFTALATMILIGIGGLVTTKGVGMAVPDWPNTFGYNMFVVPFDRWIGQFGVFEEHAHRLVASFVGFWKYFGFNTWSKFGVFSGRAFLLRLPSAVRLRHGFGILAQVFTLRSPHGGIIFVRGGILERPQERKNEIQHALGQTTGEFIWQNKTTL